MANTPSSTSTPGEATPATGSNSTPLSSGASDPSIVTSSSSSSVSVALGNSTIHISEKTFSTTGWEKNLVLDITKSNWQDWSHKTSLIVRRQGFTPWLDGSLKCPDEKTISDGYWIWLHNDEALQGFLLESISSVDLSLVRKLKTSHEIFKTL